MRPLPTFKLSLCMGFCVGALLSLVNNVGAQTPSISAVVPAAPIALSEPQWEQLSTAEQQSLQPLAAVWGSLSQGHRRKWLVLAKNYPAMGEADREKLQSRMAEWAALSPKAREQARLNFAQTKKLPPDARTANWEAYQALSEDERRALLDTVPKKPTGAAMAPKPVAPSKLAEVPVTRKTPEPVKNASNARPVIDRYTLLPQKDSAAPH